MLDGGAIDDATGDDVIDGDGGAFSEADDSEGVGNTGIETAIVEEVAIGVEIDVPFVVAEEVVAPGEFVFVELATAAAYLIGGRAGLAPAVPGAPDDGRPDLRA